jgi:flagellar motor protein MotB
MSSVVGENWDDEGMEDINVWPAYVDLLAATSLLFITLIAVFTFAANRQLNEAKTQRTELLEELNKAPGARRLYTLQDDGQFVRITLQAETTFPRGQWEWATLQNTGKVALREIGTILSRDSVEMLYREVRVVGHTDQDPYPEGTISNWELSAARAAVVARYLIAAGVMNPCKVSAVGRGPFFPLSLQNPDLVQLPRSVRMTRNRRIELEIVPARSVSETQGAPCYRSGDQGHAE